MDPIGYADQMNLYAYVGNDPVNKVDPSGLACKALPGVGNYTCSDIYDLGSKVKSGRGAEKKVQAQEAKDGNRVISGRVSANYKDSGYIRGREYDSVSMNKSGHYFLKEVKFRETDKNGKIKVPGWLRFISVAAQATMLAVTVSQVKFDMGAETLTLVGKGIPGGEIELSPGDYTISWVLVDQKGAAVEAGRDDGAGLSNIINKALGEID